MITIREVGPRDADALALWEEQRSDLAHRYDDPRLELETNFEGLVASLVVYEDTGEPIATVVLRWSPYHPDGVIELKRLYVQPGHRGHGHSRVIMGAAEARASRAGATGIALVTGLGQPEAIGLYDRTGYRLTPAYGDFGHPETTRYYAKTLRTRVMVVNGTVGAGKTATAGVVHDLLADGGVRVAIIDADAICQASPAPEDDPFQQRLLFASLAALAPVYRERGFGCIVIARVVEDPDDRDRYAEAFACEAGPAHVAIVRVTASLETRIDRLTAREPEGFWRERALARTVELEDVLESLDLDDGVVSSDGASPHDVARAALDVAGW